MKKHHLQAEVASRRMLNNDTLLLKLAVSGQLPPVQAGQFAEVLVENASDVFLRRPFSIHFADAEHGTLWFLIRRVGKGSEALCRLEEGDKVDVLLPLGHGFDLPARGDEKVLLVGGGVGMAPLLLLASQLHQMGCRPTIVLGGKTQADLVQLDCFRQYGEVCLATEDGSMGARGFVTQHPVWNESFSRIYTCGPTPMMKAVAALAKSRGIPCQVSLENHMACGIGVCLCCVESTVRGHERVCTEGPVFNVEDLQWQI